MLKIMTFLYNRKKLIYVSMYVIKTKLFETKKYKSLGNQINIYLCALLCFHNNDTNSKFKSSEYVNY